MEVLVVRNRVFFFADPVVNINPTAEELAEIARLAAEVAREFGFEPKVAMLSYSNFGTVDDERTQKIRRALDILREKEPDLVADGEMQADTAVVQDIIDRLFPFSRLKGEDAERPDLPGPGLGEHLLQAAPAARRGRDDRTDSHGDVEAGAAPAAAVGGHRHRQRDGDRGGRERSVPEGAAAVGAEAIEIVARKRCTLRGAGTTRCAGPPHRCFRARSGRMRGESLSKVYSNWSRPRRARRRPRDPAAARGPHGRSAPSRSERRRGPRPDRRA